MYKIMKELLSLFILTLFASICSGKDKRTMHYFPDNGEIVCINGSNRYTRALYGHESAFRLETSDRPVFAAFVKGNCKNISFHINIEGNTYPLDSTSYCQARYLGGRRTYILKDDRWPHEAELQIYAMASFISDAAIFRFNQKNLNGASITAKVCNTRSSKFSRNGDMGVDDLSKFEADFNNAELHSASWKLKGTTYALVEDGKVTTKDLHNRFLQEEKLRQQQVSIIEIDTPDPFFNTIAPSLSHAAHGMWDGQSWQHGCIGWRMPLTGWRGAYVGDAVGFKDFSLKHFRGYANSMVKDKPAILPHPSQDASKNLARADKQWGTQMYSNGYICRNPNENNKMHHYDMNIVYIDALLHHFNYDANPELLREFWPIIKTHLEWEKRNYDPDGDHLYDAYCCIWASDALYYNSGAVTHSSAYNYRSNLLAARIAEIIGEDPTPYKHEADCILQALNERLWLNHSGHWAEYQDFMGKKRIHESAAIWSIYTPIDCEACTPIQASQATDYVTKSIPHIPIEFDIDQEAIDELRLNTNNWGLEQQYYTLSTTDWMPYAWSTNNVAHEEVANMALAFFQAGKSAEGFNLLKGDILDEMFLGCSPGNFGQISYYDKEVKEAYRDFGDNIGITSRAIINGLFGIQPDALNGRCIIKPAFPSGWKYAHIKTPYLSYTYHNNNGIATFEIEQHFAQPLQLIIRTMSDNGEILDIQGNSDTKQTLKIKLFPQKEFCYDNTQKAVYPSASALGLDNVSTKSEHLHIHIDLTPYYNSNVDSIYRAKYLTPRSPYTTLQIPIQGIGNWCHPDMTADIEDEGLRNSIHDNIYDTGLGLRFHLPSKGFNIAYTSLWDNYPDSIEIPINPSSNYSRAYLMLAGSTNNMQSRIDNGLIIATYADHTTDTLHLINPLNWPSIEQDYLFDDAAFRGLPTLPYRFRLDCGTIYRTPSVKDFSKGQRGNDLGESHIKDIPHGAGVILNMPLNSRKQLTSIKIQTLSNDILIGVMGITLERKR